MMKKIYLIVLLMMTSLATFAQREAGEVSFKPAVGVSSANMTDMEASGHIGFLVGADVEYQMSDMFALSGGLYFATSGCQTSNMDITGLGFKAHLHNAYLNVPVLLNAYVAEGFAIKAGLQPGILLSSKLDFKTLEVTTKTNVKDILNTVDLAIPVGLSYEYNNIVFDARYNIGISNVVKSNNVRKGYSKNQILQFTIGYRF